MMNQTLVIERDEIFNELESIEAEIARRDLHYFIQQTWHLVEPDKEFSDNWHLREMCKILEKASRGEIRRVIFNIPPGTMKSLILVFWRAWEWASRPQLRYLNASYGAHLTIRDNLRLREIITSEWYQRHFGVAFVDDQNQKIRFNTAAGGWCIASSIDGVGTGEHPDRIIVDDPHSAQQARSDTERSKANDWFDRTISSRGVTRDVVIIVAMQRLHEDDLSGHLLAKGGKWTHVCFPMRYETKREKDPSWKPDPRDPRTEPGELLWPNLFTPDKVRDLELDLGPYGTAGQLQQRPAPEGGGLFKREWFKFVGAGPRIARRCRGWDTAATEETGKKKKGDYTAGVRLAEATGQIFIEDVRRERLGPSGVDTLMKQTALDDGKACAIRELREPGGSGKAVTQAHLTVLFQGWDYGERRVANDKVTEARPLRAQCEGGNVYLVRTGDELKDAWIEPFIRELCDFPTGSFDDQVDGASCAYNSVLELPPPTVVSPTSVSHVASYWNGPSGVGEDEYQGEEVNA